MSKCNIVTFHQSQIKSHYNKNSLPFKFASSFCCTCKTPILTFSDLAYIQIYTYSNLKNFLPRMKKIQGPSTLSTIPVQIPNRSSFVPLILSLWRARSRNCSYNTRRPGYHRHSSPGCPRTCSAPGGWNWCAWALAGAPADSGCPSEGRRHRPERTAVVSSGTPALLYVVLQEKGKDISSMNQWSLIEVDYKIYI